MSDLPPLKCNGCTLCCRGGTIVPILPEDPDPATYQTKLIGGYLVLAHKANGDCAHLGAAGCMIYDRRPLTCRVFDCRGYARLHPMREWKILAKKAVKAKVAGDVDLSVIRHGKRLLAKLASEKKHPGTYGP